MYIYVYMYLIHICINMFILDLYSISLFSTALPGVVLINTIQFENFIYQNNNNLSCSLPVGSFDSDLSIILPYGIVIYMYTYIYTYIYMNIHMYVCINIHICT